MYGNLVEPHGHYGRATGAELALRSPNCLATQLEYAKIPVVDDKPIGTEPMVN